MGKSEEKCLDANMNSLKLTSERINILLVAIYFSSTGIINGLEKVVGDKAHFVFGFLFWGLVLLNVLKDKTQIKSVVIFSIVFVCIAAYFAGTLAIHPEYKPFYLRKSVGVWDDLFSPVTGCIYAFFIIILADKPRIIWKGLRITAWINLIYFLIKIYHAHKVGYWVRTIETGKLIHSTYDMGVGYGLVFVAVIFLCQFLKEKRIIALLLSGVSVVLVLQNGSRGALLCYALCIVMAIICKGNTRLYEIRRLIWIGLFAVVCAVGLAGFKQITSVVGNLLVNLGVNSRTIVSMAEGTLLSGNGRNAITELALSAIKDGGIVGLGAFGDRPYIAPHFWWGYSHNFILEIICDFGLILGPILVVLLLGVLARIVISPKNDDYRYVFIVFVSMAAKLFISDTIWGYTRFWALLGLVYLFYFRREKCTINIEEGKSRGKDGMDECEKGKIE